MGRIRPTIYWENILEKAQAGRGDGSVRARATVKDVDVPNKRFRLESIRIIDEFGPANVNNIFNGCILYFAETNNKYQIVEWTADSTTAWVVTSEIPYSGDVSPARILKLNYEANTRDYPVKNATDWNKSTFWKQYNPSQPVNFHVFMHNHISNGGFEYRTGSEQKWTMGQGWRFHDCTTWQSYRLGNVPVVSHYITWQPRKLTRYRSEPYPLYDSTISTYNIVGDGTVNCWIEGIKFEFFPLQKRIISHYTFDKDVSRYRTNPYPAPDSTVSNYDFVIGVDGTVNCWIEGQKVEFLPWDGTVRHYIFYKPIEMFRTEPYPAPDHTISHYNIVVSDATINCWIEGKKVEFLPLIGSNGQSWDSTILEVLKVVKHRWDTTIVQDLRIHYTDSTFGKWDATIIDDLTTFWDTTQGRLERVNVVGKDMMGHYCARWSGENDGSLYQVTNEALSKDKNYAISAKVKFLNYDSTRKLLRIRVMGLDQKSVDSDFVWYPDTTSKATWQLSSVFRPDYDIEAGDAYFYVDTRKESIHGVGSLDATIAIDEIYFFEAVTADRFVVEGHNWSGGVNDITIPSVRGCFCDPGRTHFEEHTDTTNILYSWIQRGSNIIVRPFNDSIFPVYWIYLGAKSSLTYEAPIIYLGSHTHLDYLTTKKFDPYEQSTKSKTNVNLGGKIYEHPEYTRKEFQIEIWAIEELNNVYDDLRRMFKTHVGNNRKPVLVCWDELNNTEETMLARVDDRLRFPFQKFSDISKSVRKGILKFEEEL